MQGYPPRSLGRAHNRRSRHDVGSCVCIARSTLINGVVQIACIAADSRSHHSLMPLQARKSATILPSKWRSGPPTARGVFGAIVGSVLLGLSISWGIQTAVEAGLNLCTFDGWCALMTPDYPPHSGVKAASIALSVGWFLCAVPGLYALVHAQSVSLSLALAPLTPEALGTRPTCDRRVAPPPAGSGGMERVHALRRKGEYPPNGRS